MSHTPSPPTSPSTPSGVAAEPRSRVRRRRAIGWLVFAVVTVAAVAGGLSLSPGYTSADAAGAAPTEAVYVVVPHPDDEFQVWSLVEDSPKHYKVFVVLTHGEQTQFCEPDIYAESYQAGLEPPAEPTPAGRWSPECDQARDNSLIRYLSDMSASDPSIPGDFATPARSVPLPGNKQQLCRADGADACTLTDTTAQTWVDRQGRGAVVFFNLGDGDLTEVEARWGIRTALDRRAELGLDTALPTVALLGSFANTTDACFSYPHPDHKAVHAALWNTDFRAGLQAAATCADDPDRSIADTVVDSAVDAAFRIGDGGERVGAHTANYGWLWPDYYRVDRDRQSLLFTQHQYFWVRFNA